MKSISQRARSFAQTAHSSTNHLYDGKPYFDAHICSVVDVYRRFKYLIPEEDREVVEGGCYGHDTIEDTRVTYNDVLKACGEEVANIVYALTNEKGRNRKERANAKYYEGIRNTPYATFVKFCDRIANIEYGISTGGRMVDGYRKEHPHFMSELYDPAYDDMAKYMEVLLEYSEWNAQEKELIEQSGATSISMRSARFGKYGVLKKLSHRYVDDVKVHRVVFEAVTESLECDVDGDLGPTWTHLSYESLREAIDRTKKTL